MARHSCAEVWRDVYPIRFAPPLLLTLFGCGSGLIGVENSLSQHEANALSQALAHELSYAIQQEGGRSLCGSDRFPGSGAANLDSVVVHPDGGRDMIWRPGTCQLQADGITFRLTTGAIHASLRVDRLPVTLTASSTGLGWEVGDRAGECEIDFVAEDPVHQVGSVTGEVCGHPVSRPFDITGG